MVGSLQFYLYNKTCRWQIEELKDAFMYHSYLADTIEVQVLRGEMKRPTQAYTYGLQYSGTEMSFSRL